MKICLYSPYVPKHQGGGEKYFFDVATLLAEEHDVTVALPQEISSAEITAAKAKYASFLQLSLENIIFAPSPLHSGSLVQKALWTHQFDVCFLVTDGSFFFSLAGKNIVHIQIPFTQPKKSLLDRVKLSWWPIRNANSNFTQSVVEQAWQTQIQYTHYPMISPDAFQVPATKEPIILNVGRFFRQLHSKRQDVLVKAFSQLCQENPQIAKKWKLVLVGGIEDQSYVDEVRHLAEGLPVEFYHDLNRTQLLEMYAKASIYWHAAGFQVDQTQHPEKVEHFGISTGEAMASGCVPLVVGKGGQVEVLGETLAHLQWQTVAECVKKTTELIACKTENPNQWTQLQEQAVTQAQTFSRSRFRDTLYEMIEA